MKYLMLYEAFKAKAISDIINFLKSKNYENLDGFIYSLNKTQKVFDLPLSDIRPEEVKYLPRKSALKLVPSSDTQSYNEMNIYNMKFWFSLEKGYLGSSVTKINTYLKDKDNKSFTPEELTYIQDTFGIKKDEIYSVEDYSTLKTGDKVLLYIKDKLLQAYIYTQSSSWDYKIFAIQDSKNGSSPEGGGWRDYGRMSWILYSSREKLNDHHKLHLVNDELSKERMIYTSGQVHGVSDLPEVVDYAVVIDINSIYKRGFKKVTDIRQKRSEDKEGAIALMSDEEIKRINIDNYFTQMFNKMGISLDKDEESIKDLENFIKTVICQDKPFYTKGSISYIMDFSRYINKFLLSDDDRKENTFKNLLSYYKNVKEHFLYKSRIIKRNLKIINDIIENDGFDDLKELFNVVDKINDVISKYINSLNIDNLKSLNSVYYKLNYVNNLISDEQYELNSSIENIIFNYITSSGKDWIKLHVNEVSNLNDEYIKDAIDKLSHIYEDLKLLFNI